jgi:acetyl-CoA acetyltransferase
MRPVAITGFAQNNGHLQNGAPGDETELVQDVVSRALAQAGLSRDQLGFVVSGSSDMLVGCPFSFVAALDGVGAFPPMSESHVEMDGAFALYEAWVRLQHGDIDAALVYSFGLPSSGPLDDVLVLQLEPYCTAPLWPGSHALAAMQARVLLDAGLVTEADMAEVVVRSRRDGASNPYAAALPEVSLSGLLAEPYHTAPLRPHALPPNTDGAAAVVLVAGDRAHAAERPAWIKGIDHRIDVGELGLRDLRDCASARLAGAGAGATGSFDVAEICAPYAHQELLLRRVLGLDETVKINPSGGAICHHPTMSAGLIRIGEAASAIRSGEAKRALATATSGACNQQTLVAVLEGSWNA